MLTSTSTGHQTNLFGTDLLQQLDPTAPLLQLAQVIPWPEFDQAFTRYYRQNTGRPANFRAEHCPASPWVFIVTKSVSGSNQSSTVLKPLVKKRGLKISTLMTYVIPVPRGWYKLVYR